MTEPIERDNEYLKRYKSYPMSHFSTWRIWVQMFLVCYILHPYYCWYKRAKVFGKKRVPKNTKMIIAANHISSNDPPMVSVAIGVPVAYMAKKELFQKKFAAEFYRLQGCFALDRDNPDSATLKTALNVLKAPAKWSLGIFPEGTRSLDGKVQPLKKGIGGMAQKSGLPILPVGIFKDAEGRYNLTVGELITDVSDPDNTQQKVYDALVHLADPSWDRSSLR